MFLLLLLPGAVVSLTCDGYDIDDTFSVSYTNGGGDVTYKLVESGSLSDLFTIDSLTTCPTGDLIIPSTHDVDSNCSNIQVATIAESVFADCIGITSVEVMAGVLRIGANAFAKCTGMEAAIVPLTVTSMGDSVFADCSSLQSIQFHADHHFTEFGLGMFENCRALESVILPNLYDLGERTFSGCWDLSEVDFGGLKTIGKMAFSECLNLTRVRCGTGSIEKIDEMAFYGCVRLTTVIFPSWDIGARAFAHCIALEHVYGGSQIGTIGEEAFLNCSSLASITLPATLTTIGYGAFQDCVALEYFAYCGSYSPELSPDGDDVFTGCDALLKVHAALWNEAFAGSQVPVEPDFEPDCTFPVPDEGTTTTPVTVRPSGALTWTATPVKTPATETVREESVMGTMAIAGIAIGGVVLIGVVIVLIVFLRKRRRDPRNDMYNNASLDDSSDAEKGEKKVVSLEVAVADDANSSDASDAAAEKVKSGEAADGVEAVDDNTSGDHVEA